MTRSFAAIDAQLHPLLQGDERAISEAFDLVNKAVKDHHLLLPQGLIGQKRLKQQIIVEAFTIVQQRIVHDDSFTPRSIIAYMFGTIKNLYRRHLRKNEKHVHLPLEEQYTSSLEDTSLKEIDEAAEQQALIDHLLSTLTPKCRMIIRRFYYMNHSHQTISEDLGYASSDTVKSQKSRCIKQLYNAYLAYTSTKP